MGRGKTEIWDSPLQTHSFSLHNMFLLWLLWSFLTAVWTFILAAPIHCRGSIGEQENVMLHFFKSVLRMKQTHLGLSKISSNINFWLNFFLMIKQPGHWWGIVVSHGVRFQWAGLSVWFSTVVSSGGTLCFRNAALLPKLFLWQLPWKLGDSDSP